MKQFLQKSMATRLVGLVVTFFMMVAVQGMAQRNNSSGGSSAGSRADLAVSKPVLPVKKLTKVPLESSGQKILTRSEGGNVLKITSEGADTEYADWQTAMEALKSGDEITLLSKVILYEASGDKMPDKSCTINGDGKTLEFNTNGFAGSCSLQEDVIFKNIHLEAEAITANGKKVVFDSGVTVKDNCDVYGGGELGTDVETTSITIKDGATLKTVYGGGYAGKVTGNTNIVVDGGTVTTIFGGGYNSEAIVERNTNITINNATSISTVYGGGDNAPVDGTANLTISDGNVGNNNSIFGGGNKAGATCGNTNVILSGGTINAWVFGGGNESLVSGTAKVSLQGSIINKNLYGGGRLASATCQNTDVQVSSGSLANLYGGGENGPVIGESKLTIDGSASASWTFGGCYKADCGSTDVTLNTTGTITGGLYGGCRTGSSNTSRVNIKQGTVTDLIYGGGEQEASVVTGDTYVTMDGGSCIGVYGGGWQGQVNGTTHVLVNGGTISDAIYGGGYGSDQDNDKGRVGNTEVRVTGVTTKSTVFGDGLYGCVTGNTSVIIEGGKFDGIYGSGPNGQIEGKADILVKGGEISVLRIASNNIPEVGGSITIEGNPTITNTINSCQNITGNRADDFKLILKGCGTKENPLVLPTIDRFTDITLDNSFITIESVNPSSTEYPAIRLLSGKATTIKGKGLTGETLLVRSVGGVPSTSVPLIIGDFPSNLQFSYFYSADTKYPLFKAGDTYQLSEYKDAVAVVLKTVNITQPTHGALAVKWIGVAGNHDTELDSGDKVPANTELTLSVIPEDGYQGGSVFANGVELTGSTHSVTDDVTFSAQGFTAIPYTVSVTPTANGTITATPNTNVTVGTEVALTILPNDGYRLKSGSLQVYKTGDANTTVALSGNSFRMPAYDVTVMAEFEGIPAPPPPAPVYYTVSLPSIEGATTDPAPGDYEVESWNSFRFYLTLDEDYNQSEPLVTTDRGETITPRNSDGAYIVKYVRSDVGIFIDGVVKNPDPVANAEIESGTEVWVREHQLFIRTDKQEKVSIYTFDGQLRKAFRSKGGDEAVSLPAGGYIVSIGEKRFKVIL